MFRVDVQSFATQTAELVQVTQNVRVQSTRTSAALDAFAPSALGEWWKAGKATTSFYKKRLENLEDSLTNLTDSFIGAGGDISGNLQPKYRAVLDVVGAGGSTGQLISFDASQNVSGGYGYLVSAKNDLRSSLAAAQASLAGLERSGAIGSPLDSLSFRLDGVQQKADDLNGRLATYRNAANEFEETYSAAFDPKNFDTRLGSEKTSDGIGTFKNFFLSIPKHGFAIGRNIVNISGFWKYRTGNPYQGSSLLERLRAGWSREGLGWKDVGKSITGSFDFLQPSKWGQCWNQFKSGAVTDNLKGNGGSLARTAGVKPPASGLVKWSNRLEAGGKLIGYAADALTFVGIGADSIAAFQNTKGSFGDKLAAGATEAVKGTCKFVAGKAVGAAGTKVGVIVGTAIGGPIGGVIGGAVGGFVAGTLFDAGWKGVFG